MMRCVLRTVRDGVPTLRVAGLAAAAVLGLGLGAPDARAVDLKTIGAWTAFKAQTSDGMAICGLSSELPNNRRFNLKWYKGDNYLTVQVFEDTWQIPANVSGNVTLTFLGSPAWTRTSAASNKPSSMVEISFQKPVVQAFVKQFTTAPSATMTFGPSEPPWELSLSGAGPALDVMAQCIDGTAAPGEDTPLAFMRAPVQSQPFGPKVPSTPFGPGGQPVVPKPTQPF